LRKEWSEIIWIIYFPKEKRKAQEKQGTEIRGVVAGFETGVEKQRLVGRE